MFYKFIVVIICSVLSVQVVKSGFAKDNGTYTASKAVSGTEDNKKDETKTDGVVNSKKKVEQPDISFDIPDYDFGKIYRGMKIEHIFKFTNKGVDDLKIEKVRSSCGCTAVMLSSKVIAPGKTGEVKATFNSQSFTGSVKKKITVYSNDPDTPKLPLSIFGEVDEEVIVNPKRIDFSKVSHDTSFVQKITIKPSKDFKLKIEKFESTNPIVKVELKEDEENGYILEATIPENTSFGRIDGSVIIHTNSKNQSKITVPFYGEVIGDFSIYPPKLSCGIVVKRREMVFPVYVVSYKEGIKVERVEIDPAVFDIDITETKINSTKNKKNTYKISVILKKDAPDGVFDQNLKIYTNSKVQPIIEIPVKGEIRNEKGKN